MEALNRVGHGQLHIVPVDREFGLARLSPSAKFDTYRLEATH